MRLRVLSGIIFIRRDGSEQGSIRVGFHPHRKLAGDAQLGKQAEAGPPAAFLRTPAAHVALRQIDLGPNSRGEPARWEINDAVTRHELTVGWVARGDVGLEEISYLVVGEVAEPRPAPRASLRGPVPGSKKKATPTKKQAKKSPGRRAGGKPGRARPRR